MNSNDSYVTDVTYTQGYYAELSPSRVNLALLQAGHPPLPPGPVCELGFGQGVSFAIHAASHPDRPHHGNDFNPAHVVHAQALAQRAGIRIHASDEAFEEYCERDDLPPFAFVALHGVWSWVSQRSRDCIVEFLKRRLAPGGVAYVSYNVGAGWVGAGPIRELMWLHAQRAQAPSVPSSERARQALQFASQLFAMEPATVAQNPAMKRRLDTLLEQEGRYLAHEYLNANWHVTSFAEVSQALGAARLEYVGSSILSEQIPGIQLTPAQQRLLAEIPDQPLRQASRDFFTGQSFRRDLWIKGATPYAPRALAAAWADLRLVPTAPIADGPIKLRGSRGEATLPQDITGPLLRAVQEAPRPITVAELQSALRVKTADRPGFMNVLTMLLAGAHLDAARDDATIEAASRHTDAFNAAVLAGADANRAEAHLVSPATGVGVAQSRLGLMFLAAVKAGEATATQAAASVARRLLAQGEQVVFEGQPTADLDKARAALEPVGREMDRFIPALRRMGIA